MGQTQALSRSPPPQAPWWDRYYGTTEQEWLDDPAVPAEVKRQVMHGLHRFNRAIGAYRQFARWTLRECQGVHAPRILELGAGHGALSAHLARALRAAGRDARITASDCDPRFVSDMRASTSLSALGIRVEEQDATDIRAPDLSHDVAVFTQALHHLQPSQVQALLREGTRVARVLLIIDGWRHPAIFPLMLGAYVFGNRAAFHDGLISVRRMYSRESLLHLCHTTAVPLSLTVRFAAPGYLHAVARRVGPRGMPPLDSATGSA